MVHFRIFLILPLCAIAVGCASADVPRAPEAVSVSDRQCGDLLSEFGTKPEGLEFVECTVFDAPQIALSARYRVPGASAKSVEDSLRNAYGMPELYFTCCGWETNGDRGSLTASGRHFSIAMHSDETLVGERAEWSDIPYFHVVVEELVNI